DLSLKVWEWRAARRGAVRGPRRGEAGGRVVLVEMEETCGPRNQDQQTTERDFSEGHRPPTRITSVTLA
ncbi:hypothetical protein J6590_106828, partial [Homalodisca vitripennis]